MSTVQLAFPLTIWLTQLVDLVLNLDHLSSAIDSSSRLSQSTFHVFDYRLSTRPIDYSFSSSVGYSSSTVNSQPDQSLFPQERHIPNIRPRIFNVLGYSRMFQNFYINQYIIKSSLKFYQAILMVGFLIMYCKVLGSNPSEAMMFMCS